MSASSITKATSLFNVHQFFILLLAVFVFSPQAFAANASLSADTVNIGIGEEGAWTISGNDDGKDQYQFRWDIPPGLNVSKGSSSNLNKFEIDWDKMRIKVETDARGSFSATIKVSADSSGTYVLNNTRAEISLSPSDVTVDVGGSGGGTGGDTGGGTGGDTGGGTGGGSGSGTADVTLCIETGSAIIGASPVTGNGATTIPIWSYTTNCGGSATLPGTLLESTEGGSFTVEVVNNHNRNHNFVIQGVTSDSTSIAPGSSRTYTVDTPDAGIFRYGDTLNSGINRALGLYGALVVHSSSNGRAWSGGPGFDQERNWVITDMDKSRWNEVANSGGSVNTGTYRPDYFLMNGMNGFAAMGDAATNLEGNVGDQFLVRMTNAGQFDQSLHFHGNHFQVISRNGNRLNNPEWQDTINLKAGQTAMVLYRIEQPGHFPMHVHTAQMETGNGVYLNGTAAMIIGH